MALRFARDWEPETVNTITRHFTDTRSAIEFAGSPVDTQQDRSSQRVDSFYGTRTFTDAMDLARKGWPEGLAIARRFQTRLAHLIQARVTQPIIRYDVTGDAFDVGRIATGEPECCMSFDEEDNGRERGKITRVVANLGASGALSTDTLAMRGAAVVALVNTLEQFGHRCVVDVVHSVGHYEAWIRVKDASMPLSLDTIAFFVAHPASFRRIGFSLMEHESAQDRDAHGFYTGGGYGYPTDVDDRGDIYLPSALSGTAWNERQTMDWILARLQEQGIKIAETA